ncbi:EamA-like transporter family protein [Bryocella elongata]|uniref:EamA-like transporter family protein n=1 Tax=Bryocella elongata TaxID=863522 RepID=A0A1H5WEU4_9BACT|nr:DMT family transporter [Bryocella elongata]SEF97691.1 EamA-like transporter family protein [Bryocella elongata]
MPFPSNAFVALAAAASWGGGDFSGGMGAKYAAEDAGDATRGALRVVIVGHATSLAVLLAVLFALHAVWPLGAPMYWALAAGSAAAVSLTAFYIALSRGEMGVSAALSGLLAAAIPALVSAFVEGRPGALTIAGFVLAGAAIWAIAAGPSPENADGAAAKGTMTLALIGGVGFGFYFTALKFANPLGVLEPIALARSSSLATCLVLLAGYSIFSKARSPKRWLSRNAVAWAMGIALLDTGGNLLFVASTRLGRLDVASVLASLYPAGTILLAAWRLHERPTRRQLGGMLLALGAVVMITL